MSRSFPFNLIVCTVLSISFAQCIYHRPMLRVPTGDSEISDSHSSMEADQNQDSNSEESFLQPHSLGVIPLNDTSVVVKWELGDSALDNMQFFKIQYRSSKKQSSDWITENRDIPPSSKAYQLNGFKPGNYFFVVTAVYDNDDNSPSKQIKYTLRARSKIKPDDMPTKTAPKIYWTESGPDWIMLKWKYDFKDKDLEDTGYLVYYRSSHHVGEFSIYQTEAENMELIQLEHETPYEVKVVAYNRFGVSDFSDIVTIKTSKPNDTTVIPPSTTTPDTFTRQDVSAEPVSTTLRPYLQNSTALNPLLIKPTDHPAHTHEQYDTTTSTTIKPIVIVGPTRGNQTNQDRFYFDTILNYLRGIQQENALYIAYAALMILLICSAILLLFCLTSCQHCKKKSPPSSTNASFRFDIEINGYFKNSFPGVEDEYPTLSAHHGFVNNHPHLDDCT